MPEITPQQMDEYRTQQAIREAVGRHMHFDKEPLCIKVRPRKVRSDKAPVVMDTAQQPLTTLPDRSTVGS